MQKNEEQEIDVIDEIVKANIDALCKLTQEGFMTFVSSIMELYFMERGFDVTEIAQEVAIVVTLTHAHMALKDVTSWPESKRRQAGRERSALFLKNIKIYSHR